MTTENRFHDISLFMRPLYYECDQTDHLYVEKTEIILRMTIEEKIDKNIDTDQTNGY